MGCTRVVYTRDDGWKVIKVPEREKPPMSHNDQFTDICSPDPSLNEYKERDQRQQQLKFVSLKLDLTGDEFHHLMQLQLEQLMGVTVTIQNHRLLVLYTLERSMTLDEASQIFDILKELREQEPHG